MSQFIKDIIEGQHFMRQEVLIVRQNQVSEKTINNVEKEIQKVNYYSQTF